MNQYRVIIWGTGQAYACNFNALKLQEMMGTVKVLAVMSNNKLIKHSIDGYPFLPKREAAALDFDYCLVAIDNFDSILDESRALGIPRDKLIPLRVFSYPNFDFDAYIRLKKSNISIISPNCWGGYCCYHTLGLEFLSPTINMFFKHGEYYKFVKNLEYYLSLPVEYSATVKGPASGNNGYYPVGMIGDISLHFLHYVDFNHAKYCWEKRKTRVNFNNLLIAAPVMSDAEIEKWAELPYEHKLILGPYEDGMGTYRGNVYSHMLFETDRAFNLISLLNHESNYVRIT